MTRPSDQAIEAATHDFFRRYPRCQARILNAFSLIVVEGLWVDINQVPEDQPITYWLDGFLITDDPAHYSTCSCHDFWTGGSSVGLGGEDQPHRRCCHLWLLAILKDARLLDLAARAEQPRQEPSAPAAVPQAGRLRLVQGGAPDGLRRAA